MSFRIKKKIIYFLTLSLVFNLVGMFNSDYIKADASVGTDNIIKNSGFEINTIGSSIADNWVSHGIGSFEVTSSLVSGGSKAQKVSISNLPMNHFAGVSQTLSVKPGQPYNMNGRFYIESISNAKVQLYADFFNAGAFVDSKIYELPSQATGQFVTLGGNGSVPKGATSVVIYALIRSGSDVNSGTFITDNISFQYTNDSNLIANSDYENFSNTLANSDDWDYTSSFNPSFSSVAYPSLSGARAQKMKVSSLPVNGYAGILQKIKVDPGKSFQASGALIIESLSNAKAQIYIDFMSSSGNYTGTTILEYAKPTNGIYMTLSDAGQIPKDTTYAVIYVIIRGTGNNGSGSMYVDSLNFHYTNEANLFNNGNFEATGSNGLGSGWLPSYGNTVQQIDASNIKDNDYVGISQMLKVVPAKKYTMSGRLKVDRISNAKVQLYADFFTGSGAFIEANIVELPATTQGGYITISNTGSVPSNADYARIYAIIRATNGGGAASINIDDMRFSYSSNLLDNADFEVSNYGSETPLNWTVHKPLGVEDEIRLVENSPAKGVTTNSYSAAGRLLNQTLVQGTQTYNTSYKYDLNGNLTKKSTMIGTLEAFHDQKSVEVRGFGIPANQFVGISQTLRVIPDKSYMVTGKINISMLNQSRVQMYIDFYAMDGSFVSSSIKDTTEANGKYMLLTNEGVIPSKAVFANVYFLIRSVGDSGAGTFYLDSASFDYR
ncbi:RHS repeat domain-containing protein [Paenibacillus sp. FSL H8-0122]|uniref:RHS repeat domain-containing protein n=1 Tax=Paenibacillus sp. FSL H8-0122 TaxID=2954510 RepID=UPI0030F7380B